MALNTLSILIKFTAVIKGLFFFAIAGIAIAWLADKLTWRYQALVIDRRDTSGKVMIQDKAAMRRDKQGNYYIKLSKCGGRVEMIPNAHIYHSKGRIFGKGMIIVNKISENTYVHGSIEDINTIKKAVPKLDNDGNPVLVNGKPVMEEKEVNFFEAIHRLYEPSMSFARAELQRDAEKHKVRTKLEQWAPVISLMVLVALVAFCFLMTVKYGNANTQITAQAAKDLVEMKKLENQNAEALWKSMIALRDRDCNISHIAPDELLAGKVKEVVAAQEKAAQEAAQAAPAPSSDKGSMLNWLRR